jgi:hypothetical protein
MESKEELVSNIKDWIKIDNDIAKYRAEIKTLNQKKKFITESLVGVMKKNEIDCFDINDGSLVYKKTIIKKPINAKTLVAALQSYAPEKATEITQHILESRQEEVKETIRRKRKS